MENTFAVVVKNVTLNQDSFDPPKSCIVEGSPEVFSSILSTSADGKILRGIWKCTVGVVTDIEEDEMFTIIEGRAKVEVEGGPVMELSPGTVGFFTKGARTTWTIYEDILKTFQITLQV